MSVAFGAAGAYTLAIQSDNTVGQSISFTLSASNTADGLSAAISAINDQSSKTGVTAALSADGTKIQMTNATGNIERPAVRQIAVSDVFASLREGYEDFREKPSHYAFVALIYPIAGAMMIGWSAGVELLPMVYPLLTGFALLGPLMALGLMEISRRRELGQPANWSNVLDLFKSPSLPSLLMMSAYLVTLFMVWLVVSTSRNPP